MGFVQRNGGLGRVRQRVKLLCCVKDGSAQGGINAVVDDVAKAGFAVSLGKDARERGCVIAFNQRCKVDHRDLCEICHGMSPVVLRMGRKTRRLSFEPLAAVRIMALQHEKVEKFKRHLHVDYDCPLQSACQARVGHETAPPV